MTLNNDKLLGFQFGITLIPLQVDSICRYMVHCATDVGEVLVLHMEWGLPQLSSL